MTVDPAVKFLRRISIRDHAPDTGERYPVHVSSTVLFDGVECPFDLIYLNDGWEAMGKSDDGTIVSLTVDASRAKVGQFTEPGAFESYEINGTPVLVPRDYEWEALDAEPAGLPARYRAHIFVREFECVAAPKLHAPSDRRADTGE